MKVHTQIRQGDKDLIDEYIDDLPIKEQAKVYSMLNNLRNDGIKALEFMNTRQLRKKLYEIKFTKNRFMYVIADEDNIYIVHACRKQKGKAEEFEIETAIKRAKEIGRKLNMEFV